MKIGVLSDTHNHLPETRRALTLLLEHGAQHLVHCGDAGEDSIDLLSAVCLERGIRAHVALGNCDPGHGGEDARFAPQPEGIERGRSPEFTLAGKRCAAMHGNHATLLDRAASAGIFDYVFTGHTHQPMDERCGRTRVLNPGSCARPRRSPPTVLVLDLESDQATWLPV